LSKVAGVTAVGAGNSRRGAAPTGRGSRASAASTGAVAKAGKPADSRVRLDSLTGLRFVAAFLVFGFHTQVAQLADTGVPGAISRLIFTQGSSGVSFFFILSGFVLTWSVRANDTARRFWQRRFAKVYPNHFVTMLVAIGFALVTGVGLSAAVIIPNALLVQAWFPDPTIYFGLNTVSWSLACEAFFYALFPLLYLAVKRIPVPWLWAYAIGAMAAIWAVPVIVAMIPGADHYWAIWLFPVARTPEFVAGMVLARVVREGQWPRWLGLWVTTALAVVVYLPSQWYADDIKHVAAPAIPFALLIAAVAAADVAGTPSPWRSRRAVWLGEISFAFYMVHHLVLRLVVRYTGSHHNAWVETAIVLLALALSVLAAWALFRLVETPCLRWLSPRRAPAPSPHGVVRHSARSGAPQPRAEPVGDTTAR
jgi:peptidoglycan/LPS O-acetylase OafA/YrhL